MEKCKLRITCAGIYNAGKSSLLNALTGGNNFAVGDIPTTATIDEFETDKYIYVDTPGLNANNYDNATAEKAFKSADLILFVSNMQNGGLNAAEAEYLRKLSETLGGMEILQAQVLFAMSNLHQIEDDAVNKVIEEHKSMINLALGFVPETVCVFDSVTYQEGLSVNEPVLIEASCIPALISQIGISAGYVENRLETLRSERLLSQYRILRDSLNQLVAPLKKEYDRLKQIVDSESVDESKVIDIINQYREKSVSSYVYGGSFDWLDFKKKYFRGYNGKRDVYSKKYSSESALISDMKNNLSELYNNRQKAVMKNAKESAKKLKNAGCYEHISGNDYFDKINQINKNIIDLNSSLSENNINLSFELIQNFNIEYNNYPNMSYDSIYNEIVEETMNSLSYGNSLSEYIEDYAYISEDKPISINGRRSLFSHSDYSSTSDGNIADKISDDVRKEYDENCKRVSKKLESYLSDFCNYLNQIYNERLNKIESEVRNIIQAKNNTETKKQLDELWEQIAPLLNRIEEMEKNL